MINVVVMLEKVCQNLSQSTLTQVKGGLIFETASCNRVSKKGSPINYHPEIDR